jgi:DNA-directed RNA polymerase III subunit RPC4
MLGPRLVLHSSKCVGLVTSVDFAGHLSLSWVRSARLCSPVTGFPHPRGCLLWVTWGTRTTEDSPISIRAVSNNILLSDSRSLAIHTTPLRMPPKARGRGGRGRGGTARGASSAATPVPDPVVPKEEDDGDAAVPPAEETPSTVAVDEPAVVANEPTSTATEEASATQVPRQRLDSLATASSRSASPSVRGRGRGKKPAPAMPVFTGRRSKAEREQRTAEAQQRELERNKDREKQAERLEKAKKAEEAKKLRFAGGRGGYSGVISGPFSDPTARPKDRTSHRGGFGGGGGYGASGSGSGSRGTAIKSESGFGGGSSSRSAGTSLKREDGGHISSDDDDSDTTAAFPRRNVDTIHISSDEDEAAPQKNERSIPVRIRRQEHKERVVGINTEASSEGAAKNRQKAEETGNDPAEDVAQRTVNKGKGKTKDLEITGERKQYKGVWQDSEDSDVKVKTEPGTEDEEMLDAEDAEDAGQMGIGAGTTEQNGTSPDTERKSKPHYKGMPEFQTDEERAEWIRYHDNLGALRAELGDNEPTSTVDEAGDVAMTTAGSKSVRDGHIYLFQLPPVMPDLSAPSAGKEISDVPAEAVDAGPGTAAPTATAISPGLSAKAEGKRPMGRPEAVPIKKEEDFSNPLADIPEQKRFTTGYVGKLRVHKSGRTTLDWGGTSYELTPGKQASFLQEIVSIHVSPEADQQSDAAAGEAIALGSVKGKFVVTPDFEQMFKRE